MKSLLQAAAFIAASASAFVIPPSHPRAPDHAVAGPTVDGVSAYFSIPCHGCFADTDEELEIEIKLEPTHLQCRSGDIVVNDVRLPPVTHTIQFTANTSTGSNASDIKATWELICLDNDVTVLTLRVNEVVGQVQNQQISGFSTSFRQSRSPAFLRLEHEPYTRPMILEAAKSWKQEQSDPDFTVISTSAFSDQKIPDELQQQLRRLHVIKAQIGRLHHKHMRQERLILDMIKEDFYACEGAKCFVRTAFKKAPELFELLKAHFRHHPDWNKLHEHKLAGPDSHEDRFHRQGDNSHPWGGHHLDDRPFDAEEFPPHHTPFPAPIDRPDHDDSPFPSPPSHPPPPPDGDDGPPPPWEHDGPPPHHPPSPPPEHHGDHPPSPPPEHHGDHPPPPPWHHHGRPGPHHTGRPHRGGQHRPAHHRPHFLHRYGPHQHPFFFSAGSLIFFAVVASLAFRCVRAKTGLFRNAKRTRDRAARREECRNRAAYRRAAIQHSWARWWSQFRQPESTSDYEEKRARIVGQEGALEDVMQTEIRDLRRAHELVGDLMRAEEGRQRLYHEANFGSPSNSNFYPHAVERQTTEASRSTETTLPPYQPPPPSYDQELEGEMTVVDGFNYTPSATDSTPDSSVIDCNSRMSFDTDMTVTK